MSATYDQRVFRWGEWHQKHRRGEMEIVGYEHNCGAATLVEFDMGYDGTCCSGCRFEIQHPEGSCKPIYRPAANLPTMERVVRIMRRVDKDGFSLDLDDGSTVFLPSPVVEHYSSGMFSRTP